ncbi:unnamed protein product [Rotaria sp. Silwood1]|nr:unnamed protein product [Rotaria sp. Silwood1]
MIIINLDEKTLSTVKIASIYYDQPSITNELNIEIISLLYKNEFVQKIQEFYEKNILSIYTSNYRLCGIIPFINSPSENSFTIYWLFKQIEKNNESIRYDYCIIEYQVKSSFNSWTSLLNLMSKQE